MAVWYLMYLQSICKQSENCQKYLFCN